MQVSKTYANHMYLLKCSIIEKRLANVCTG